MSHERHFHHHDDRDEDIITRDVCEIRELLVLILIELQRLNASPSVASVELIPGPVSQQ